MATFVRHLTLQEANALLPLVLDGLLKLRGLLLEERAIRGRLRAVPTSTTGAEALDVAAQQARLEDVGVQAQQCLDRIGALGAQVKGVEPFLVDFPARLDGQTVLLCWQEGEQHISHYHPAATGFAGRKAIESPDAFGSPVLH